MTLEAELAFYQEHLPELLEHHRGQYAVIRATVLLGTYTTALEAFSAGIKAWGNQPFLIRKVSEKAVVASSPAFTLGLLHAHP